MHMQAARSSRAEVNQCRQQVPRPRMPSKHAMLLAKHPPVHGMHDAVALSTGRVREKRGREQPVARCGEGHIDRVVHAAGHHRFKIRVVIAAAEDMPCPRAPPRLPHQVVRLLGKRPLRELDPPIRRAIGTV